MVVNMSEICKMMGIYWIVWILLHILIGTLDGNWGRILDRVMTVSLAFGGLLFAFVVAFSN